MNNWDDGYDFKGVLTQDLNFEVSGGRICLHHLHDEERFIGQLMCLKPVGKEWDEIPTDSKFRGVLV